MKNYDSNAIRMYFPGYKRLKIGTRAYVVLLKNSYTTTTTNLLPTVSSVCFKGLLFFLYK